MSKVYYRVVYQFNYVSNNTTVGYNCSFYVKNGTMIPYSYNNTDYVGDTTYLTGSTYGQKLGSWYSTTSTNVNYHKQLLNFSSSTNYASYFSISNSEVVYISSVGDMGGESTTISTYGGYISSLITGNAKVTVGVSPNTYAPTITLLTTYTISGRFKKQQDRIVSNWSNATGYSYGGEALDVNFAYNGVSGYKMILFSMVLMRLAFCTSYMDITNNTPCVGYTAVRDLTDSYIEIDISTGATINGDGVFDFGSTEQEVPDTFYQWLIANFDPVGDYTFTFYTATGEVIETIEDAFSITSMTLSQVASAMTLTIEFSIGSSKTIEWISDIPEGYYFAGLSRTYGGTNVFIEPNTTSTTEVSASSDFYEVFLKYGDLPNVEFAIDLMQNTAENNRVDKTNYLTTVTTLSGALRHETSVINPVILIDLSVDGATIPEFNYVYIAAFNRYYYLRDLVAVRTGIWQMSLQCDVLMTYKDTILEQYAFINRSSNNYNDYIADSCQPMTVQKSITRQLATNTLGSTIYPMVNITNIKLAQEEECAYIVTVLAKSNTTDADASTYASRGASNGMNTQAVAYNTTDYTVKWLLNYEELNTLAKDMVDPDFWSMITQYFTNYDDGAVISILAYPRDLYDIFNTYYKQYNNNQSLAKGGNIYVFNTKMADTDGYKLTKNCLNQRWYAGSITFNPQYNNFLDYGEYCKIQLYLPCVGTVDIPVETVLNKTVDIWYVIDWETGGCTVFLETTDSNSKVINIGMYTGQYGTEIAIISSDYARIVTDGITGALSSKLTGSINAIGSIVDGKMGSAISSGINAELDTIKNTVGIFTTPAGVSAASAGRGIENQYMSGTPYAIISRAVPVEISNYAQILGKPAGIYAQLKDLNGYTQVGMVHLQDFDTATRNEVDEIETMLHNGVMLINEDEGTLDPSTISFSGAVGADAESATTTLTTADGDALAIASVVLTNTALGNNISYSISSNTATFTCSYNVEASGNYTAVIYDSNNNKYSLTISLDIGAALELANSYIYFDNVTDTQTATVAYSGKISSIVNPDEDHIAIEYNNTTGTLTVTYSDPDSTASSVAYITINGTSATQTLAVYCVFPLTVDPDTVDIPQGEDGTYTITVTGSGSDLNGGGFNITDTDNVFNYTTDNKTYITINYTAGSVDAGDYTLTLTDIYLGTTATVTITVTDSTTTE